MKNIDDLKDKFLSLLRPKRRPENPYGDMLSRSLAACFDVLMLFFILYDFLAFIDARYFPNIGMDFSERYSNAPDQAARVELLSEWIWRSIVQGFCFGVVIVGVQSFTGTTPGKWIVGLKIVRAKTHEPISPARFLLRFIAYIPACAPLMLGIFWIGFNKERRGWHDYIADTVVLNLRPQGWYWNHTKRGFRYLKNKIKPSAPLEQTMGEPPAEQRHGDSDKPVN